MENPAADEDRYRNFETRISVLTLVFGVIAAPVLWYLRGPRWGGGIFAGSVLSWLSFRWLRQGLDALRVAAEAQANQEKVHVPVLIYLKALFRYGLIALVVYVIFEYLNVPVLSMVIGLCALGAATLVISVHEILRPQE
jgi:hypothetical protein